VGSKAGGSFERVEVQRPEPDQEDVRCRHPETNAGHGDPSRQPLVAEARARRGTDDLVTRRRQRVPEAAERVHALSVRAAGLLVAREEVEGVAVVGDLRISVRAGARRGDRSIRFAADGRLAGRPQGGQSMAQAPVHALFVPASLWKR
jgi:hypothetical protein